MARWPDGDDLRKLRDRLLRVKYAVWAENVSPPEEISVIEVSESQDHRSSEVIAPGGLHVDLYMVRTPRYRPVLFLGRDSLDRCARLEVDRFGRAIHKLTRNRYGVVRWVGRVTQIAHQYYQRLEDRIDPLERMIKALNCPSSVRVLHAPSSGAEAQFRDLLQAQIVKHWAWLVVDGLLTTVAVMFFWVLVPIPGPNVFFYYPALRLMSHYRATTGARRALNGTEIEFSPLPRLAEVENELRKRVPGRNDDPPLNSGIEGLDAFLKRIS